MFQTILHSTKFQILSIFLLALVLRLFYLAAIRDAPYFHTLVIDAFEYDHLATQILQGNWLLDPAADMYVHGPLYPYLLALLKGIGFGHLGILLFQAVLGALICVLIHRVAIHLFPHPIPLVAGLLAAGYWPFVFYNGQLLATTLVMLVGLGLAVLLLRHVSNLTYGSAVGAGILLGLLVMGRSNTLLLLPLLLGWIYLTARGLPKRRVALVLAFSLTFFLILFPFFLRNYQVQGTPIPFQGGFSFYIGTNPEADGTPYVRQGAQFQRLELMPLQRGFDTPAAKGAFYTAEGLRFMYREPLAYLQLLYRKFRLFWNAFEIPVSADLRYYETYFPFYRLFLLSFGLVVPFALVGILWHWQRTSAYTLPLLFVLAYLFTGLMFSVCARYRLPALPFLLVFAAAGIWRLKELLTARAASRLGVFLLMLAAAFALVHTGVEPKQVDHLRSPWLLGHTQLRNKQYDQAVQTFTHGLAQSPDDSDLYNSLGVAYQYLGKFDEAEAAFLRAVELVVDHAKPWFNLGKLYLGQRRLDQARHAFAQSLKHDPRPANAHPAYHNLGYVFFFQKDFQQARQAFERALHNRETAQTYYSLSHVLSNLNLTDEQIHALERAVRLKPDFVPAHRNLGVLYMQRGSYETAERSLLQAIKHDAQSITAHRNLGVLYEKMGRTEQARLARARADQLQRSGTGH